MCIETMNLATSLLPKFAFDIGFDSSLLQLISVYQKNPGTETYQAVQQFLLKKREEQQKVMNTFSSGSRINLNILDYEDNLLWSTAKLEIQDKIVLLYQSSEYSSQSTQGSAYKKFEDGSEFNLSWVSGGPIFAKGGALKFGSVLNASDNATVTTTGSTVTTISVTDPSYNIYDVSYNVYTFNGSGSIVFSNIVGSIPLSILAVAGGGGGSGGGGGAGGYVEQSQTVTGNGTITITVGAGGDGGSIGGGVTSGQNTTLTGILSITALGGGEGGSELDGGYGGSGGGGVGDGGYGGAEKQSNSTSGGYGNAGGYGVVNTSGNNSGGGGGGALYIGGNASTSNIGGAGGSGRQPFLAGLPTETYYAGGGGGYPNGVGTTNIGGGGNGGVFVTEADNGTLGGNGIANRGGGGGANLGYGGSGVVIIAIPTANINS